MTIQTLAQPTSGATNSAAELSGSSNNLKAWVYRGLFALLGIICFTVLAPCDPRLTMMELDNGWGMALHWAFVHHAQFGTQIVFTFGPWGFLWSGFWPETFRWMMGGWLLLSIAAWLGMLKVSEPLARPILRIGFVALAITLCNFDAGLMQDVRLYLICLLIVPIHFYVDGRPISGTKSVLCVAMALAALIKFSIFVFATGIIGIVSLDLILSRKWPWPATIFVAAMLAFWVVAHQSLGNLIPYLGNSWRMASAYTQGEAFTIPGETRDLITLATTLGMLTALLFWAQCKGAIAGKPGLPRLCLFWSSLVFSYWILLKFGFVRHDEHGEGAKFLLCLLVLAFIVGAARGLRHPPIAFLAGLTIFGSINQATTGIAETNIFKALISKSFQTFCQVPARLTTAARLGFGRQKLQSLFDREIGHYAQDIPRLSGSVDCYPWGQSLLFADHANYQPRPTLQSYAAFTDYFQNLNSRILAGANAPDEILLKFRKLDETQPSTEDGLSWPYFLTRYDVADISGNRDWMLLQKSAHPRTFSLNVIGHKQAILGEWIDVPVSADPIWISLDVRQPVLTSIQQMIFKSPELQLNIEFLGGAHQSYQLLPEVARGGFLLSPNITGRGSFALLESLDWRRFLHDRFVKRIQVACSDPAWFGRQAFNSNYSLIFSSLDFEHQDISLAVGAQKLIDQMQADPKSDPDQIK